MRDAAIFKLLLLAGLRVGELIRLRLDDLVLDDRRGSLLVREGKAEKCRVVPLNAQARRGLQVYLRLRPETEAGQVFIGQRGKPIQSKTVQRAVTRFAQAAGLKGVTPHMLRHTFAKGLIDSGVELEKVAALLGHASLSTTRIYFSPGQDLEEVAEEERFW